MKTSVLTKITTGSLLCLVSLGLAQTASAGTATWTGSVDTNWSNGGNWSGGTGTAGVPGASDVVLFGTVGAATSIGAISNYVDDVAGNFAGTVAALEYTNNVTATFQNTRIAPGLTLNVTGNSGPFSTAIFVGSPTALAANATMTASISGAGATLNVNNTNANISLSQSGGSGALAILNMTNLDNFVANINLIAIGDYRFGVGTVAAQGSLILARTNTINTSWAGVIANPYGTTANMTNSIQLGVGSSSTLGGINAMFLGLSNSIFADSIGIGGVKGGGSAAAPSLMAFAPVFTNSNPTALLRGRNGVSSRITLFAVGDTAINSGSSAQVFGKVDFSNGYVDALIDTLILGRDRNGTAPADAGAFSFSGGNFNVNTLLVGDQGSGTTGSACTGTMTINAPPASTVDNATLIVNNNLELGHTTLTGGPATALNTSGTLNVTNGTVYANNILVGVSSVTNRINLNRAVLVVTNALTTNASGVFSLTMSNSVLGFTITDASLKGLAQTLTTAGTTNVIQLASVPVFGSYPKQFSLVKYVTLNGAGFNFGLSNTPASAPGAYLSNNAANNTIDLVLPASPAPVITAQPIPFAGSPGDNETTNFLVTIAGTSVQPLSFQWYSVVAGVTNPVTDGLTANGSTFTGSGTSNLFVVNAQIADNADFFVVINNTYGTATSSAVSLLISTNAIAPGITGLTDTTVIQNHTAVLNAAVSGKPTPDLYWVYNGSTVLSDGTGPSGGSVLSGTATSSLSIANAQYPGDGGTYSLIASNSAGSTTNTVTLTVIVPPTISQQPGNLVVTNGQPASFTVASTGGVPNPTYQWKKNGNDINPLVNATATNSTFTIGSTTPTDTAIYSVLVQNAAGSVLSSNVTLIINSAMSIVSLTPGTGSTGICYDTLLTITFSQAPTLNNIGTIKIYNATNPATPVDTLTLSIGNPQARLVGGINLNAYAAIITGNTAVIHPHSGVLAPHQTYYVTIDDGAFKDSAGAYFEGITDPNTWSFTTKFAGPGNPTNIVVATDSTGDFCTVQGAIDSIPNGNTTHVLMNIHNGVYTELIRLNGKNNITFRGEDRHQTIITYANNDSINGGTANRPMFGVLGSSDVAMENLTLTNSTPKGGSQAEALYLNSAKRFILLNADLSSYQDTLLVNAVGDLAYMQDSRIQGDTDFIWGQGTLFVTNCEIKTLTSGSGANLQNITQARTPAGSNGFSFVNCRLTRTNNSITLGGFGRALGFTDGNVAFINCLIDDHISGWGDVEPRYWEYGNSNLNGTLPKTYNGVTLQATDPNLTNAETAPLWLYGWTPQLAPNILSQPVDQSVNAGQPASFTVTATGIPNPTYTWMHGNTQVQSGPSATLLISNAQGGDIGAYTVIVTTPAGSVTSSVASLSVNLGPVAGVNTLGTTINTAVSVSVAKIVASAHDPEGDAFGLVSADPTSVQGGTITLLSGNLTYTPATDFTGSDQFNYILADVHGNQTSASVSVTVSADNLGQNQVGGLVMVGPNPQVTFAGIPGRTYSIQRTPDLITPVWSTIGTATADAHGQIVYTDTNPLVGQAFYRTVYP